MKFPVKARMSHRERTIRSVNSALPSIEAVRERPSRSRTATSSLLARPELAATIQLGGQLIGWLSTSREEATGSGRRDHG
jgi:hypothetical protein